MLALMLTVISATAQKTGYKKGIHDFRFDDGRTYSGQWLNRLPDGQGTMTYANGESYTGTWLEGKRCGEGKLKTADGSIITGIWADDQLGNMYNRITPSGDTIRCEQRDGHLYETVCTQINDSILKQVTFIDGQEQDDALYILGDKTSILGRWEDGLFTGAGTLYDPQQKCLYEGHFVNNIITGEGVQTYDRGVVYEGHFVNGLSEGWGKCHFANGDEYIGEWKDDHMHGQGLYIWKNGEKYIGEMRNGRRNGHGTGIWPSGEKYVGEWENGVRSGHGTNYWVNGDVYVGQWENDKMNGRGTRTYAPGQTWIKATGIFRNGAIASGTLVRTNGTFVGRWDENGKYLGK